MIEIIIMLIELCMLVMGDLIITFILVCVVMRIAYSVRCRAKARVQARKDALRARLGVRHRD